MSKTIKWKRNTIFTDNSITLNHNAGFFSCCTVKLSHIVDFINLKKKLPDYVDSSKQFNLYKKDKSSDITYDFFKNFNNIDREINIPIMYNINPSKGGNIYKDYSTVQLDKLYPIVEKYFSPSENVLNKEKIFMEKYKINPEEFVAVYYRGSDKYIESKITSFKDFGDKLDIILSVNNNLKILLLTDTEQCLDYFKKRYKDITFISENKVTSKKIGIHTQNSPSENYKDILNLLATFLIVSKCKYIVSSSSNCGLWMMFYRKSLNNVYQYANGDWFCHFK